MKATLLAVLAAACLLTACGGCADPDTDDDGTCRVEGVVHQAKDCA